MLATTGRVLAIGVGAAIVLFFLLVIYDAGATARERQLCANLRVFLLVTGRGDLLSEIEHMRICDAPRLRR